MCSFSGTASPPWKSSRQAKGVPSAGGRPSRSALFAHFSNRHARGPGTPRVSAAGRATNCMTAERFTLDTNILVHAVDAREGRKRDFATRIIEAAVGLDCPLALQVVGEFYAAATTKLKLDARDAAARAAQLIAGFDTFGYSVHAVRAALDEVP